MRKVNSKPWKCNGVCGEWHDTKGKIKNDMCEWLKIKKGKLSCIKSSKTKLYRQVAGEVYWRRKCE